MAVPVGLDFVLWDQHLLQEDTSRPQQPLYCTGKAGALVLYDQHHLHEDTHIRFLDPKAIF